MPSPPNNSKPKTNNRRITIVQNEFLSSQQIRFKLEKMDPGAIVAIVIVIVVLILLCCRTRRTRDDLDG